jgi:hypothetical protein
VKDKLPSSTATRAVLSSTVRRMSSFAYKSHLAHLAAAAFAACSLLCGSTAVSGYIQVRANPSEVEGLVVYSTISCAAWSIAFALFAVGSELAIRERRSSRWVAITLFALGLLSFSASWWAHTWAGVFAGFLRSA